MVLIAELIQIHAPCTQPSLSSSDYYFRVFKSILSFEDIFRFIQKYNSPWPQPLSTLDKLISVDDITVKENVTWKSTNKYPNFWHYICRASHPPKRIFFFLSQKNTTINIAPTTFFLPVTIATMGKVKLWNVHQNLYHSINKNNIFL